jgi:hypothetical protein
MGKTGDTYPAWIEWLFQSGIGLGNFDPPHALFRQRKDTETVLSMVESEADGARQLRAACLNELDNEDAARVERAIFYLMMVGRPEDIAAIEKRLKHSSATTKKAVKTCRFELRQRFAPEGA